MPFNTKQRDTCRRHVRYNVIGPPVFHWKQAVNKDKEELQMKKVCSMFLALVLLTAACSLPVSAASVDLTQYQEIVDEINRDYGLEFALTAGVQPTVTPGEFKNRRLPPQSGSRRSNRSLQIFRAKRKALSRLWPRDMMSAGKRQLMGRIISAAYITACRGRLIL